LSFEKTRPATRPGTKNPAAHYNQQIQKKVAINNIAVEANLTCRSGLGRDWFRGFVGAGLAGELILAESFDLT